MAENGCSNCTGYATNCSCGSSCGGDCSSCYGDSNCQWSCDGCSGCSGSCKSECTGECTGSCNAGCNTGESQSLAAIELSTQFEADNISDIAKLIYLEAYKRSPDSAKSKTFSAGQVLSAADMAVLIDNLVLAGQTPDYTAPQIGDVGYKVFGQNLIDKAKAAYNTVVGLP